MTLLVADQEVQCTGDICELFGVLLMSTLYNAFVWKQENLSLASTHMLWKCSSTKFHETLDIYVISKTRVSKVAYNKRMEAEMHIVSNWTFRGQCVMI